MVTPTFFLLSFCAILPLALSEVSVSTILGDADKALRDNRAGDAVRLFSEALALAASPKIYYDRHRAYLKLSKFANAVSDLTSAIEMDGKYSMAYLQRGNLHLLNGRCSDAASDYEATLRLDANKRDAQVRLPRARTCQQHLERAAYARQAGDWAMVRDSLKAAMEPEHATKSPSLQLQLAEAYFALGEMEQCIGESASVLKLDPTQSTAYALRGRALMRVGDFATARSHFSECLQYDPDNKECKDGFKSTKVVIKSREKAEAAKAGGQWAEAAAAWREALAADATNPYLHKELRPAIARALHKAGDTVSARAEALAALQYDDGSAEARMVLAELAMAEEKWDEAVQNARRAHESDRGNNEYRDMLQRAEAALKQSKNKDYYKILGIPRNADDAAIKRAYRALAKEWHPDRHSSDEDKLKAEAKFRDIGEANEILSDSERRAKYDRGEDVTGNQQQGPPQGHPFFFHQGGHPGGFQFHFNT